jgi:AIPR protein
MSIFKVLESNIERSVEDYSEYLSHLKKPDELRGSEFMLFSLSTIFKDKTLDEIENGVVDSSYRQEKYDFGIDAIYITASKDFIEQPEEIDTYNEDTKFKIHIFQFKRGQGIAQADLLKLKTGIKKALIDEKIIDTDNLYFYNRMLVLNEIKTKLFTNFSSDNISVVCHIVFGGIEAKIYTESILNDALNSIEVELKDGGFNNYKILVTDCEKLINNLSKVDETIDIVEYQKTMNYITNTDEKHKLNGFISIVKGSEIANLVKKHQTAIFEANIRDFYKRNDLNSKITSTSSDENEAKYFWSYNNGLTMTCTKVEEMPNNKYKLYNLQIVNGCQTSNAIYHALKNKERVEELNSKKAGGASLTKKEITEYEKIRDLQFKDETSLLVKIIETKNDDLVYRITETTNSQTPIQAFSLKANDDVQKLIEKYFESKEINYERRINSLRNKNLKNIYSIQKLFQLYTSQLLYKPSQVKTNPKTMFNSTYDAVFPSVNVTVKNYALYLIPIKVDIALTSGIKEYYKTNSIVDSYLKTLISYGKLHLGCFLLSSILKKNYSEKGIANNEDLIIKELDTNFAFHFNDALTNFEKVMKAFAGNKKESIPIEIRKSELDSRIVRFIKART